MNRDPASLDYLPEAMEQVVEAVMSGLCVPKSGATRIDLDSYLDQRVPVQEQTEDFIRLLTCSGDRLEEVRGRIKGRIEEGLRAYLTGHQIVADVAARMAEEAMEEA